MNSIIKADIGIKDFSFIKDKWREDCYKQINDQLRIQPDGQYIMNPGAVSGVKDALVAGVRIEISL